MTTVCATSNYTVSTEMEKEINDFVGDTQSHCFICMDTTSSQSKFSTSNIHSLQNLSRHLKLNLKIVFDENAAVPQHLLSKVERSNLKVSLCEECACWNDSISRLYKNLKKIELEMVSYLEKIHAKLSKSEDECKMDRLSNPNDLNSATGLMVKLKIAKVLRTETKQKCYRKMGTPTPRVPLQKMTEKEVILAKQKFKRKSTNYQATTFSDDINMDNSDADDATMTIADHDDNDYSDKLSVNLKTGLNCNMCGKSFTLKQNLRQHLETVHQGRRYQCKFCLKWFSQSANRSRHVRLTKCAEKNRRKKTEGEMNSSEGVVLLSSESVLSPNRNPKMESNPTNNPNELDIGEEAEVGKVKVENAHFQDDREDLAN